MLSKRVLCTSTGEIRPLVRPMASAALEVAHRQYIKMSGRWQYVMCSHSKKRIRWSVEVIAEMNADRLAM